MKRDQAAAEAQLANVARQVWSGSRGPNDFVDAFVSALVYVQRPEQPALLVTDLGERGKWMAVFTTLERLAAHVGECGYFTTTGSDLLELVPPGVGLMVDPDDAHRFPVLSRMAPPELIARAWAHAGERGRTAD
ncbi:SseB family protein [Amycolatopsis pretoriensis]|uniref:SseB family protein n=1 Tax=Amycolatopsis pretoriensis TaxID=218821 RepID=UPI001302695A|nr:SseB family protein [Amycolatopsis pretoriensis]